MRNIVLTATKLFTVLLLSLLLVELVVRIYFAVRYSPHLMYFGFASHQEVSPVSIHENNAGVYSKYFPKQKLMDRDPLTESRFTVKINSHGYSGKEYQRIKPDGVIRVISLGGSSTFGYGNRDHDTYPAQLELMLNDRCAEPQFEVINLGIPHLGVEKIASLLDRDGAPLEPDIITFYGGYNNSRLVGSGSGTKQALRRMSPVRKAARWGRSHSLALTFLLNVGFPNQSVYSKAYFRINHPELTKKFITGLTKIDATAQSLKSEFLIVTQQARSLNIPRKQTRGLSYAEELGMIGKKLREQDSLSPREMVFLIHGRIDEIERTWAAERELTIVDGAQRLDRRRDLLYSYVHLLPEGNTIIAEAIAVPIIEKYCRRSVKVVNLVLPRLALARKRGFGSCQLSLEGTACG